MKRGSDDLEDVALTLLFAHCRFEIRRPDELYDAFRRVSERALAVAGGNGRVSNMTPRGSARNP
jgi:hypothetical protein